MGPSETIRLWFLVTDSSAVTNKEGHHTTKVAHVSEDKAKDLR